MLRKKMLVKLLKLVRPFKYAFFSRKPLKFTLKLTVVTLKIPISSFSECQFYEVALGTCKQVALKNKILSRPTSY